MAKTPHGATSGYHMGMVKAPQVAWPRHHMGPRQGTTCGMVKAPHGAWPRLDVYQYKARVRRTGLGLGGQG